MPLNQTAKHFCLSGRQLRKGRKLAGLLCLVATQKGQVFFALVHAQQAALIDCDPNPIQQFLERPTLVKDPDRPSTDALGSLHRVRYARDDHDRDARFSQWTDRMQRIPSVPKVEVQQCDGRLMCCHRADEVRGGGGIDHVDLDTVRSQGSRHGLRDQSVVLDQHDTIRHHRVVKVEDAGERMLVLRKDMKPTTDRPRIAIAASPPLVAATLVSLLSDLDAEVVVAIEATDERFDLALVIPDGPALAADAVVELSSAPGGFLRATVSGADGPARILDGSTTIIDFVHAWAEHAHELIDSGR